MDNIIEVCRVMEATYGPQALTRKPVAKINKSLDEIGSVVDPKIPGWLRFIWIKENKKCLRTELDNSL